MSTLTVDDHPALPNLKSILMSKWHLFKTNHCLEQYSKNLHLSHTKKETFKRYTGERETITRGHLSRHELMSRVTLASQHFTSHTIFCVPIWSNKMLILMEPSILSTNNYLLLVLICFNFFFINRLQVSLTSIHIFLYISCLQAIYFVFLGPENKFFQYFPYVPYRKIMVRP